MLFTSKKTAKFHRPAFCHFWWRTQKMFFFRFTCMPFNPLATEDATESLFMHHECVLGRQRRCWLNRFSNISRSISGKCMLACVKTCFKHINSFVPFIVLQAKSFNELVLYSQALQSMKIPVLVDAFFLNKKNFWDEDFSTNIVSFLPWTCQPSLWRGTVFPLHWFLDQLKLPVNISSGICESPSVGVKF